MQSAKHCSAALLFILGSLAVSGCASKPAPQAAAPPAPAAPPTRPAAPAEVAATQPALAPARDVLAEQAAAYAAKMEEILAKRVAAAEAKHAATRAAATAPAEATAEQPVIEAPDEIEVPDPAAVSTKPKPGSNGNRVASRPADPADDAQPASAAVSSDTLLRNLTARAKSYPRDLAVHLDYQLLQLVRDEKVPGMPDIAALPAEDRELLSALLDALSNFRGAVQRDNNMLQSAKVRPLVELGNRLRAQSELTIPTLALCKKVKGFGVYDPIEPEFSAGRAQQVIVYCEVENFSSQLNDQQVWETKLTQDVVLYTETGLPVWQAKQHTVTDLSRNRRRDFFVVEMVELPGNLTIGRYLMKVSVVDQNANRIAESTLPVKIVARAGTGPLKNGVAGQNSGGNSGNGNNAGGPTTAPQFLPILPINPAASLPDEATK
jgi:hypothetical protein